MHRDRGHGHPTLESSAVEGTRRQISGHPFHNLEFSKYIKNGQWPTITVERENRGQRFFGLPGQKATRRLKKIRYREGYLAALKLHTATTLPPQAKYSRPRHLFDWLKKFIKILLHANFEPKMLLFTLECINDGMRTKFMVILFRIFRKSECYNFGGNNKTHMKCCVISLSKHVTALSTPPHRCWRKKKKWMEHRQNVHREGLCVCLRRWTQGGLQEKNFARICVLERWGVWITDIEIPEGSKKHSSHREWDHRLYSAAQEWLSLSLGQR